MKSLEDRLKERSRSQLPEEVENSNQKNADALLVAELRAHVRKFASKRMISVETTIQANMLVINKGGKKMQIQARARDEQCFFDIHVARRGDLEGLDEDAVLDQLLGWLLSS